MQINTNIAKEEERSANGNLVCISIITIQNIGNWSRINYSTRQSNALVNNFSYVSAQIQKVTLTRKIVIQIMINISGIVNLLIVLLNQITH